MSEQSIKKIINETVFTMWAEGYIVTDEEKAIIDKVLSEELNFSFVLEQYINNAKMLGGTASV